MDPLVLLLAVLVGVALGLLGGGGSILMVPLLVYAAGVDAREAIAMSLVVVGTTAAASALGHARAGRVRWRTAAVFGVGGIVGAYAGGRVGALLPGTVLLVAFALMMLTTAAAMLRDRRTPDETEGGRHGPWLIVLEGVGVGFVTGLVGAGGGFLVVPALVLLGGLSMPAAVGTSLAVIALKSGAALVGYLSAVSLDWGLTAVVTGAAVAGAMVGARLVDRVPAPRLRRVFGWAVLVAGVGMLLAEAPPEVRTAPLTWAGVALGLGGIAWWVRRTPGAEAQDDLGTGQAPADTRS